MAANEKTGNVNTGTLNTGSPGNGVQQRHSILYFDVDSSLYQIVSCYLNLTKFKVVASLKAADVLHKLDRQKFSCLVLAPDSDSEIDLILSGSSGRDSLNHATPIVIIAPADKILNVEESHKHRINGVVKKPFKLSQLHQTLLAAMNGVGSSPNGV